MHPQEMGGGGGDRDVVINPRAPATTPTLELVETSILASYLTNGFQIQKPSSLVLKTEVVELVVESESSFLGSRLDDDDEAVDENVNPCHLKIENGEESADDAEEDDEEAPKMLLDLDLNLEIPSSWSLPNGQNGGGVEAAAPNNDKTMNDSDNNSGSGASSSSSSAKSENFLLPVETPPPNPNHVIIPEAQAEAAFQTPPWHSSTRPPPPAGQVEFRSLEEIVMSACREFEESVASLEKASSSYPSSWESFAEFTRLKFETMAVRHNEPPFQEETTSSCRCKVVIMGAASPNEGLTSNPKQYFSNPTRSRAQHSCSNCSKTFSSRHKLESHFCFPNSETPSEDELSDEGPEDNQSASGSDYVLSEYDEEEEEEEQGSPSDQELWEPNKSLYKNAKRSWRPGFKRFQLGQLHHQCRVCKLKLSSISNLRRHYKLQHGVRNRESVRCDDVAGGGCSAYFRTQNQLKQHKMRSHQESHQDYVPLPPPPPAKIPENAIKCRRHNCTSWFTTLAELESHQEQLHGKLCNLCGKGFPSPNHVRKHRYRLHMAELDLRFRCGVAGCGRAFEHPEEVVWHKQVWHKGTITTTSTSTSSVEEPPQTPSYSNSTPWNKSRHKTGEFKCSNCKFTFTRRDTLQKHRLSHHWLQTNGGVSAEVHKCPEDKCAAYFLLATQLRKHQEFFHRKSSQDDDGGGGKGKPKKSGMKPRKIVVKPVKGGGRNYQQVSGNMMLPLARRHARFVSNRHQCNVCKVKYSNVANLRRHYQDQHGGVRAQDSLRCEVAGCPAYFGTQRQLRHHKAIAHNIGNGNSLKQQPPSSSSSPAETILEEEVSPDEEDPQIANKNLVVGPSGYYYKCDQPQCSAAAGFNTKLRWESHRWKVHGKGFPCRDCGSEFVTLNNLRRHRYSMHEGELDLKFGCGLAGCGKKFESQAELTRHANFWHKKKKERGGGGGARRKVVSRIPPSKAKVAVNKKTELLKKSTKAKAFFNVSKNGCKNCGKEFPSQYHLRRHRYAVHVRELELRSACGVAGCGKKFETEEEALWHQKKTHKNLKETSGGGGSGVVVPIPEVDRVAAREQLVQATSKRVIKRIVHEGKRSSVKKGKPFGCDLCGKVFRDRSALNLHLKVHEGPDSWDFECSACGKKYISKNSLERHWMSHTGERPFSCDLCGLAYARKDRLKGHKLRMHPDSE